MLVIQHQALQYMGTDAYIWQYQSRGKIDTELNSADLQTKLLQTELYDKHIKTIMGHNKIFNANIAIDYYNKM